MEAWKRNLYSLWTTEFLAVLGVAFVLPFLPFFIRELGVSDPEDVERWSGFIYAAPFLATTISGPVWGWLGDRYGRRLMLLRALLGFAVVSFLMAFAQSPHQLFLLRLIQGAISGFVSATLAIVSTTTPRERMGYAMGVLQTSLTAGTICGPLIGGFLADQLGYRNMFFLTAGLGCLATILVIFLVREDERVGEPGKSPGLISNYRFVFTSPTLLLIIATGLIVQLAIMAVQPILSLFVETLWPAVGHLATVAGGVFAVTGFSSLIVAPFWGKRGDRSGYRQILFITLLGAGITFAPQGLVNGVDQLLFLRFLQGLFLGGILPALYTLTTLNTPEERCGGVLGITRSGLLLGNAVGPIAGGIVAASFGMRPLFFCTGALLIGTAVAARRMIPGAAR
jgi:DHA1 family multidrug resistance protein-like MFS transporter